MKQVSEKEIKIRLAFDNPWWEEGQNIDPEVDGWGRRAYFDKFIELVSETSVRRAVVLMGPRRVGKTVMIHHAVKHLLDNGVAPDSIFYVTIENPVYVGLGLEKLLHLFQDIHGHERRKKPLYVFFDEVQYLKGWEVHLKSLVDSYSGVRFVASGSAAAALAYKSRESGAGRFTDFMLPPLTFAEFLRFMGVEDELFDTSKKNSATKNIDRLNEEFVDYVNFGGFPEPVVSPKIRADMNRFIGNDIIDKVLLKDLPSLYGIQDSRELNQFFSVLAYNTGNEVSLDGLSKASGVAKNTIRKYLEYLEAAFLIRRLYRVDHNARRFKRAVTFKVYLTNPCLRAAFFGSIKEDDEMMGFLAETAIVAQLTHLVVFREMHYARWKDGEVDLVRINSGTQKPEFIAEIKWSDRCLKNHGEIENIISFAKRGQKDSVGVLIKSKSKIIDIDGVQVSFIPTSEFCYWLGKIAEDNLNKGVHPFTGLPFA